LTGVQFIIETKATSSLAVVLDGSTLLTPKPSEHIPSTAKLQNLFFLKLVLMLFSDLIVLSNGTDPHDQD
jgi:hypothetical protein